MSLDRIHILSSSSHYAPFVCPICQSLPEVNSALVTCCSHVFCPHCIETWLARSSTCPSCNSDLKFSSQNDSSNKSTPDCSTMMIGSNSVSIGKLSFAQPLADRLMKRIRVACPFREKHGCSWEGDYNELQSHLLSSTSHLDKNDAGVESDVKNKRHRSGPQPIQNGPNITLSLNEDKEERRRSLANSFKAEANTKFCSHNYVEARDLYTKALSVLCNENIRSDSILPKHFTSEVDRNIAASLYANRAAVDIMLKDYPRCVEDCDYTLALNVQYTKAYVRKSRALVQLGNFHDAVSIFQPINSMSLKSEDLQCIQKELDVATKLHKLFCQGNSLLESKKFASAKESFSKILRESNASILLLKTAEADIGLGLIDSALRLTLQVIRSNPGLSEGYEVRGKVMYLMADCDTAIKLLRQGLRLNPDSQSLKSALKKCRDCQDTMNKADGFVFRREFSQAIELYSSILTGDNNQSPPEKSPLFCKLLSKRGECYLRLKKYKEALCDASKTVYSREDHVPAWLIMVKALHGLERHEEALAQLEDLMQRWGNNDKDIRRAYDNADFQVRKMKRPQYYELFGVSPLASELELKKAYKQKAKELHPDRLSGSSFTDDQRREAENHFKMLGEGLEILCDDFKRQLYDEGYDPEAIRERVAAAQQAAHRQGNGNYHHHNNH